MTYNKKEGKLFTDFDEDQIHDMIKGISESAHIEHRESNKMFDFYEMNESNTGVKLDISALVNTFSDGAEQEEDDFFYFINGLKNHGMKDKDWMYDDEDVIIIPSKYLKFTKSWDVKKVK
jgi:hypothetical protein